jgi:DNA-binding transcriptional MerR regulator
MINFIFYVNPTLTLVCVPSSAPRLYSLETAAHLTGVPPAMLRRYCRLGLLRLDPHLLNPVFNAKALEEIRQIERWRRQQGVNLQALPALCQLAHDVERLQAEVRALRSR